tara:strand:- start:163 stop:321 length:159 start_codon:yes stop_codon:yes gene_type:complete
MGELQKKIEPKSIWPLTIGLWIVTALMIFNLVRTSNLEAKQLKTTILKEYND